MNVEPLRKQYPPALIKAVRQQVEQYTDVTITEQEALVLIHMVTRNMKERPSE